MGNTPARCASGHGTSSRAHPAWEFHASITAPGLQTSLPLHGLRRMHLKPSNNPDGYYPLVKSPSRRFLYDIGKATPRRVPTERQRGAIAKMRAALVQTDICRSCGTYDSSHGQSRSGVSDGYCAACWREIRHRRRQAAICAWAKTYLDEGNFVVLDSDSV